MNQARLVIALLIVLLTAPPGWAKTTPRVRAQEQERAIVDLDAFDVPDIPAQIDGLKIEANGKEISLTCAVVNRQSEELLGLRLVLLVFDEFGNFRSRITWTERDVLAGYSINKATFRPPGLRLKRAGDHLVLGIDEVIGRETIWRAMGLEKAMSAHARGLDDVMPEVRKTTNKFDSRPGLPIILRQ